MPPSQRGSYTVNVCGAVELLERLDGPEGLLPLGPEGDDGDPEGEEELDEDRHVSTSSTYRVPLCVRSVVHSVEPGMAVHSKLYTSS